MPQGLSVTANASGLTTRALNVSVSQLVNWVLGPAQSGVGVRGIAFQFASW